MSPRARAHGSAGGGDEATSLRIRRIGFVLGPLLFCLLLLWPGMPLDAAQRRVAAVTAWTAIWWTTAALPIGMTSLLPAVLLPLLGVMDARAVAPLYMHDLVLLFLGAFVVALGLERWGVHKRMALAIIARVGTRPRQLVLGFMVASAVLSFFINNTSTTLLMLPIGTACIASLSLGAGKQQDGESSAGGNAFAMALLLGMAYSASVGGVGTPVGTTPNQVFLGQFQTKYPDAPEISFSQWAISFVPLVAIYLPLGWLVLTRLALRVPAGSATGSDTIHQQREALGAMSRPEKAMACVFGLTALLWVTRANLDLGFFVLPGWGELFGTLNGRSLVSDATVAVGMAIVCFLIPAGKGQRLMDWETARRMPWEILLLIGGGFCIAGAFKASGLDQRVGEALGPHLASLPEWAIVFLVVALMAALTEITSNTATTAVLLPVLGEAAVSAGISPLFTMLPATIAASVAFMLPVATPPNAVVFSSRLVPASSMARVGLWMNLLLILLVSLVFQLWVRPYLGIGAGLEDWATQGIPAVDR